LTCEPWHRRNKERCSKTGKKYYSRNKKRILEQHKLRRRELKKEILIHYGGSPPECACCGEFRIEFLCIDHVNGRGEQHRREIGLRSGVNFYYWLRDAGFPPGYRVLCHNCNMALGAYGYCPHQKDKRGEFYY